MSEHNNEWASPVNMMVVMMCTDLDYFSVTVIMPKHCEQSQMQRKCLKLVWCSLNWVQRFVDTSLAVLYFTTCLSEFPW